MIREMQPGDWEKARKQLMHGFGSVTLICDGHRVTLRTRWISPLRMGITPYVNGTIELKWLYEDCEERRRFMRPVTRYVLSPQVRKKIHELLKQLQKKRREELLIDPVSSPDRKYTYYDFAWLSFEALKKHLLSNNRKIWIEEDGFNE